MPKKLLLAFYCVTLLVACGVARADSGTSANQMHMTNTAFAPFTLV